jgi:PERQ amino acid-rich with GYF domain-containing protein
MILSLPPNESSTQEIISDTIYAHTSTLDGRHFAEEFLKRRKTLGAALDATLPMATNSGSGSSSGSGWNEVLKKDRSKDPSGEWNSAFKVVAGKKGRRRG